MTITHKGIDGTEHEPIDVDSFIPTGVCAICEGVNIDDRLPEDRGPENPYVSGAEGDVDPLASEA